MRLILFDRAMSALPAKPSPTWSKRLGTRIETPCSTWAGRPQTSLILSTHFRVAATNSTHEGVTAYGEKKVRARRTWNVLGAKQHHSTIEQLQLDLAAFNRCIDVLEKADVDPRDIEVLTTHALTLAEQIDEVRWSNPAKALGWLLENETRKFAARKFSGAG
jgi:hypothetical protein